MEDILKLKERSNTTMSVLDRVLSEQFLEEIKRKEVYEAIKEFLKEEPVELLKAFYILSSGTIIAKRNTNGCNLEELKFDSIDGIRRYISEEISIEVESLFKKIKEDDLENIIAEIVFDSEDFYLPLPVYQYYPEYFDNWVYGDTYTKTNIAYNTRIRFIKFLADIINDIGDNFIAELFYDWIVTIKQ